MGVRRTADERRGGCCLLRPARVALPSNQTSYIEWWSLLKRNACISSNDGIVRVDRHADLTRKKPSQATVLRRARLWNILGLFGREWGGRDGGDERKHEDGK